MPVTLSAMPKLNIRRECRCEARAVNKRVRIFKGFFRINSVWLTLNRT